MYVDEMWRDAKKECVDIELGNLVNQKQPKSDGLHPTSDGLHPKSDGLQPKSDGLHPRSDGLQPTSESRA